MVGISFPKYSYDYLWWEMNAETDQHVITLSVCNRILYIYGLLNL